jgi:hypothetical protein
MRPILLVTHFELFFQQIEMQSLSKLLQRGGNGARHEHQDARAPPYLKAVQRELDFARRFNAISEREHVVHTLFRNRSQKSERNVEIARRNWATSDSSHLPLKRVMDNFLLLRSGP